MTAQMQINSHTPPRHARLFELIRQNNIANARKLAAQVQSGHSVPAPRLQKSVQSFAHNAKKSLLPQEQAALGFSQSFGR